MAFIRFSTSLRTSRASTLVTAAGANATIKFYTGSAPANVDTAVTGTLLGTLTCGSTLGTVSNGVLTFGAITGDSSVDATGAWGYARVATSGGVGLIDLDVGTSGTSIIMAAASAVQGASLDITSLVVTEA